MAGSTLPAASKRAYACKVCTRRSRPQVAARAVYAASPEGQGDFQMTKFELKAALLDSFWGTEKGLDASAETRAEINELICALEAQNTCASPATDLQMMSGVWELVYTSNSEVIAFLALGRLPLVTIESIKQTVDLQLGTVTNNLTFSLPWARQEISSTAAATQQSPKRLNLRFEKGTLCTPEILTDIELPEFTTLFGQTVDLRQARTSIQPLLDSSRSGLASIASFISQQPDLTIPAQAQQTPSWLLTTYLDDTLRISRGDGGSVFILVKQIPDEVAIAKVEDDAAVPVVAASTTEVSATTAESTTSAAESSAAATTSEPTGPAADKTSSAAPSRWGSQVGLSRPPPADADEEDDGEAK